jgi:DNA-binding transcriptional ArsR family regulator
LDRTFHALADPTRRGVVETLTRRGRSSVKELAEPFPIGLPTFLKHLKVLEDSGLVSSEKSGRTRTCRIRTEHLGEAERWLSRRRSAVDRQSDSFSASVEGIRGTEGGQS